MLHANDAEGRDERNTRDGRDEQPSGSWPERVIDVLRRIFVPEPQPVPVLVPVPVRRYPAGPIRRRAY